MRAGVQLGGWEACDWHRNSDCEDGEPRLAAFMGRYEDWLEEEGDYNSPSETDEALRARYESNQREVRVRSL